jgi:hypothetical protein
MGLQADVERLLGKQPGLTARDLVGQLDGPSKKAVNKVLYSRERDGRLRRSEDRRPRWYLANADQTASVADTVPPRLSEGSSDDLAPYVGRTAAELNATYDLGVSLSSKHQVRQVAERLSEHLGGDIGLTSEGTTRVIRVDARRRSPAEDVQLGLLPFDEFVATPFRRSKLRGQVERFHFVLFSREADLPSSTFLGVHDWRPSREELELIEADYEAARRAIRRSDVDGVPSAEDVHVVRYGTKGRLRTDTLPLPDGTPATRRAFYLVKRYLRGVLASHSSTAADEDGPDVRGPGGELSPNAGLLLDLLRERGATG